MSEREEHKARNWVEARFPDETGTARVRLIVAYGAGLDDGLAEAQEVIAEEMAAITAERDEWREAADGWEWNFLHAVKENEPCARCGAVGKIHGVH